MKVLVIGSGGREHALAWKIAQSPLVSMVYAAPGNPGIAAHAECVDISAAGVEALLAFAKEKGIDLTVVGPEGPLVKGIVDRFENDGLNIFGPSARAAELEGSKVFARNLLRRHAIPSPSFETFSSRDEAVAFLRRAHYPTVIKADGLAAGKGAFVCRTMGEAEHSVDVIMKERRFGAAGDAIVVEEFLEGEEISILAFTDGSDIVPLEPTQDHKRVFDNDEGPNTGGMGAFCPVPLVTERLFTKIARDILVPTVHAMNREDRPYRGILYAGLMLTEDGPKVLEFNVRFGDPETQPLLMRMKSDIVPLLTGTVEGRLDRVSLQWHPGAAVCVVMAAAGYPGPYKSGMPISGLEEAQSDRSVQVFHAGTSISPAGLVAAAGRVLNVTARGNTVQEARERAYAAVGKIRFEGAHWRSDIAGRPKPKAPELQEGRLETMDGKGRIARNEKG